MSNHQPLMVRCDESYGIMTILLLGLPLAMHRQPHGSAGSAEARLGTSTGSDEREGQVKVDFLTTSIALQQVGCTLY